MLLKLKTTTLLLILSFLLNLSNSYGQEYGDLSFNKAVNISGKQRMLTQRMGKIYLYLLDNPSDYKASKDLKITKLIFAKQLSILEKNAGASATKKRLKEVRSTWKKYEEFLNSEPNKEDAVKIINTNTTILKYANNVVNAIIEESKGKKANSRERTEGLKEEDGELKQVINKSGRQRMLSQRLALYYFANKPGLKNEKVKNKLDKVFTELDDALNELLISNFNNGRIDESLGEVMSLWDDISTQKERLFKQGYEDYAMYKLSNDLTKTFNTITNLYEKVKIE